MFGAQWCSHCKALHPTYEQVAAHFADNEHVLIGEVACDTYASFCSMNEVSGYPTLRFYPRKSHSDVSPHDATDIYTDYNGQRTKSDIVAWINKQVHSAELNLKEQAEQGTPNHIFISSQEQLHTLASRNNHHLLLYFYSDWSDACTEFDAQWTLLTSLFNDHYSNHLITFAKVNGYRNLDLKEQFKITDNYPAIVYLPPNAEQGQNFELITDNLDVHHLTRFLNKKLVSFIDIEEERAVNPQLNVLLEQIATHSDSTTSGTQKDSPQHQSSSILNRIHQILKQSPGIPQAALKLLEDVEAQPNSPVTFSIQNTADSNQKSFRKLHLASVL